MKDNKKGFTLVELSIVLVIIGLLIGGILVGQSLIESAKMQSFVRQMAQYDALTATFKSKYRNLPGDATVFGCTANLDTSGNVCNNGAIEAFTNPTIYFAAETSLFWKHLSDSGFRPSGVTYTSVVPASNIVTFDLNVPKAGIGTAGVTVYGTAAGGNFYLIGNYTNNFEVNTARGLTSTDALAFDQKTDDGLADDGDVTVGLATPNADCNNAGTYNIVDGGSTLECSLAVKLMANTNF